MTKTIKVQCGPSGLPVRKEGTTKHMRDGRDINKIYPADGVVEVEASRYYRGRIAAGDLIKVADGGAVSPLSAPLVALEPPSETTFFDGSLPVDHEEE